MGKILIVDDDKDLRAIVRDVLKEEGFFPMEAPDGLGAVMAFKAETPDAVLLDLQMPGMNGFETMQELRKIDPQVPIIILTAYGDIPTAVESIKAGAYDFAVKPPEFEKLTITLKRAIERRMLEMDIRKINSALESSLEYIFGKSQSVRPIIKQIAQVAQTNFSVIVQGETGTGKSVVADALKNLSRRAEKPFVSVDIGLIPDSLVESELFGYKKGAFTGAERDKEGYIETANTGTLFIDEIENMSSYMQGKLLSVIERKKICPLGSTTPIDIDVRFISASNEDIRQSVNRRIFREDLFYRLGEFIITVPPLRDRVEDIPMFAEKFIRETCSELNRQIRGISDEALSILMHYSWPGNIRDLRNIIRGSVLLTEADSIERIHIEQSFERQLGCEVGLSSSLKDSVKELEKRKIKDALEKAGSKIKAAEMLKMSHKSIIQKIKEYDIDFRPAKGLHSKSDLNQK